MELFEAKDSDPDPVNSLADLNYWLVQVFNIYLLILVLGQYTKYTVCVLTWSPLYQYKNDDIL